MVDLCRMLASSPERINEPPTLADFCGAVVGRTFCQYLGLEVTGNVVRTDTAIRPAAILTATELIFYEILTDEGPLLPTSELQRRFLQRGMNPQVFLPCLLRSPILAEYGPGIHGLVGARIAPGKADLLLRQWVTGPG